jgi:cation transport ATPase
VITVDRIGRVADAIAIGRRTRSIARQSVVGGIGLSVCGMLLAAVGWLVPIEGALAQEAIDVAVILNALRALRSGL